MYELAMEQTFSLSLPDARVSPSSSSLSSSSSSLISPIVNLGAAEVEGLASTSVCVPTSKCCEGRGGGCFDFFFFASV